MKKIFLVLSLVSCQIYAQADVFQAHWAKLSRKDKRSVLKVELADPQFGFMKYRQALADVFGDSIRNFILGLENGDQLLQSCPSHEHLDLVLLVLQRERKTSAIQPAVPAAEGAPAATGVNILVPTLSDGLADFESRSYGILPLSHDSRFARYNPAVSGRLVTSVLRSVLTGYALDKVMTPEQQDTPVFHTCNGYLTLSRAQVAAAVVEGAYAGYVYGARAVAHEAACEAATNISMNAIDTFLERHAPQWLDYPDIVKRNVYAHIVAHTCVKIVQRRMVENAVRATIGSGVRVGMHFTFGDQ